MRYASAVVMNDDVNDEINNEINNKINNESLLPLNASDLERALELSIARMVNIPVPIRTVWRPDTCPENLLPWLAWARSVDTWDTQWTQTIKRQIIAESVQVHRTKGTRSAITRVLKGLNVEAVLSEWFEHDGPPHTFQLTAWVQDNISDDEISFLNAVLYRNVIDAVDNVKPVRSHYDFQIGIRLSTELLMGSSAFLYQHTRVTTQPIINTDTQASLRISTLARLISYVRISAQAQ